MKTNSSNRWIIAIAGIVMQIALGAVYAWSVFRIPLTRSFGWTISEVTLTFTIAIFVLGLAAFLYDFEPRQARRLFEESLQLSGRARAMYATLLVVSGEPARAFEEMAVALTEDPFDANTRQQHVDLYWYAHRIEDALAEARRLQELFPESSTVHFHLAKILFHTGHAEEALQWAQRSAAATGTRSGSVAMSRLSSVRHPGWSSTSSTRTVRRRRMV